MLPVALDSQVTPAYCCAAKLGISAKGKGGYLQRACSGRKAARSDYEEQQMLLGLKAVEKMKQMVLVRQSAFSHALRDQSQRYVMPLRQVLHACACAVHPCPVLQALTCCPPVIHA